MRARAPVDSVVRTLQGSTDAECVEGSIVSTVLIQEAITV